MCYLRERGASVGADLDLFNFQDLLHAQKQIYHTEGGWGGIKGLFKITHYLSTLKTLPYMSEVTLGGKMKGGSRFHEHGGSLCWSRTRCA